MTTKLYLSPGACSAAVHAVLHEVGQTFEHEKVSIKDKSPSLMKVNPRGAVPVLEDDGQIIREGAAILIHIAEKNKSPLLPTSGNARDKALEWLCFANSTLHPAYGKAFWVNYAVQDATVKQQLMDNVAQGIQKLWDDIEGTLTKEGPYICGKDITLADFLITTIANWTPMFGDKVKFGAKTQNLLKSIVARPSYQKTLEHEGTQYKVA